MRTHGTLAKWNDQRGFGFITPAGGGDELFVHISAFPHDQQRPRLGEVISFEVVAGSNGNRQAANVMRPGSRPQTHAARNANPPKSRFGAARVALGFLVVAAMAAYGYTHFSTPKTSYAGADLPRQTLASPAETLRCDGRTTCSQMTSCAEATYFLKHCPNTKMDGNKDGKPCEQQWCN